MLADTAPVITRMTRLTDAEIAEMRWRGEIQEASLQILEATACQCDAMIGFACTESHQLAGHVSIALKDRRRLLDEVEALKADLEATRSEKNANVIALAIVKADKVRLREALDECIAWCYGTMEDGTVPHDSECDAMNPQEFQTPQPCDCPKRLIDAARTALRAKP